MFGIGRALQPATRSWRPWQRHALAVALVAAGVALVWVGVGRGAVVLVTGALVLRGGVARRRPTREHRDDPPVAPGS